MNYNFNHVIKKTAVGIFVTNSLLRIVSRVKLRETFIISTFKNF